MKMHLSKNPLFNIKSVSEQTEISPVTLRAWERRYGFPEPQRTDSGYRLFSEYDVAALNWLKQQKSEGLTIGQAIKLLKQKIEDGADPLMPGMMHRTVFEEGLTNIDEVRDDLINALLQLEDIKSHALMQTAFGMFPLEQILLDLIQPTMAEVGERWHNGEISIATEHFATNLCRAFLINIYEQTLGEPLQGSLVAACAPGEQHELGLLTLSIMLRIRGFAVTYLGANISFERFAETVVQVRPQLLLFSATTRASAEGLIELVRVLDELPEPKPIIGLGGQAFTHNPTLANHIPGTIMGPTAAEALNQIESMLIKS
jgi:methanogenic corrinoid protein MtbC1